jgi:hypothetical protein
MKGGFFAPIAALALTLLVGQAANAAAPVVVLVRPSPRDEVVNEALIRLEGELESIGFTVSVVDNASDEDPRQLTESAGRDVSSAATIGIFRRTSAGLELWLADRLTGKTVVRQVEAGETSGRSEAQVVAIRAAELLRASLAETLLAPSKAPPKQAPRQEPAQPIVAHWMQRSLSPRPRAVRIGIEAGAGVIGSFEGIGPALVPMLRARLSLGEYFAVRAGAAGLGTSSEVTGATATATVRQEVVLAEGHVRFLPGKLVRPTLSLGVGTYGVLVDGRATWPYEGRTGSQWSPAISAGAGVALRLHSNLEMAIEAQALFAAPNPTVRFFDDEAARGGRPTCLATLSLVGWQ